MPAASTQLERLADSAVLKLVAPLTGALMLTFGTWGLNRVTDRLDRMENLLTSLQADRLVMQRDVDTLKTTPPSVAK
jgi:cytochrome oxidase assembly protein ShyY1